MELVSFAEEAMGALTTVKEEQHARDLLAQYAQECADAEYEETDIHRMTVKLREQADRLDKEVSVLLRDEETARNLQRLCVMIRMTGSP